jgi:NitT/TauT family transport system substrate-binding protein
MIFTQGICLAALTALLAAPALAQPKTPVLVGAVPSTSTGGLFVAKEKGYFAALGLDVQIENIVSASEVEAMLATNRLQVLSGAVAAGMFNSMAKNLPTKIYYNVAATPGFHFLLVRPELKDTMKTAADLKGRAIAINGRGTADYYLIGKLLETVGLSIKDIDIRVMAFGQMSVGLQNGAVDSAVTIAPFTDLLIQKGIGVRWLDPEDTLNVKPLLIAAGQMNTDWTAAHPRETVDYLAAVLRGAREYCEAFHGGANRAEIVRILAKYSSVHDADLIERMQWGASDPVGVIPAESLNDFQDFQLKERQIVEKIPLDRVADFAGIAEAGRRLGPFTLVHDDGKPGCR